MLKSNLSAYKLMGLYFMFLKCMPGDWYPFKFRIHINKGYRQKLQRYRYLCWSLYARALVCLSTQVEAMQKRFSQFPRHLFQNANTAPNTHTTDDTKLPTFCGRVKKCDVCAQSIKATKRTQGATEKCNVMNTPHCREQQLMSIYIFLA
jgi:hypothetical protein